jgi:hypothetical protein
MDKILKIIWKLHMAYCPQSSGKVEIINRTLKLQTNKPKTVPGDPPTMGSITAHSLALDQVKPYQTHWFLPF